jgi:hypothetical protein
MSPSPNTRKRSSPSRNRRTPAPGQHKKHRCLSASCDRFIPNRARINACQARATLTNNMYENDSHDLFDNSPTRASMNLASTNGSTFQKGAVPAVTPQKQAYERHLNRILFGTEQCQPRLLSFGDDSLSSVAQGQRATAFMEDPFRQDVLRATATPSLCSGGSRDDAAAATTSKVRREIPIKLKFILEAPLLLQKDFLNLVSFGPMIAVGLNSYVHFSNRGSEDCCYSQEQEQAFESICAPHRELVTAIQWSGDRASRNAFLAFGTKDCAEVWDPQMHQQLAHIGGHAHYVTALAWGEATSRPMELLAGSANGIQHYDLRLPCPHIESYACDNGSYPITSLQCRGNYTVASYEDTVLVWDVRKHALHQPLYRLHHAKVKAVELCPFQSNVLATGGADGIKVWHLLHQQPTLSSSSGARANLRSSIPTPSPVTSLLWSPYRRELLAAHGESLALWDMSSKTVMTPLAEWTQPGGGKVFSMDCDPRNGRVVTLHSKEVLACWDAFGEPPQQKRGSGFGGSKHGLLEVPVVR